MVPGFFGLFELIFPLMFLLVFGMVIFVMISNLRQWNKNNHSPDRKSTRLNSSH